MAVSDGFQQHESQPTDHTGLHLPRPIHPSGIKKKSAAPQRSRIGIGKQPYKHSTAPLNITTCIVHGMVHHTSLANRTNRTDDMVGFFWPVSTQPNPLQKVVRLLQTGPLVKWGGAGTRCRSVFGGRPARGRMAPTIELLQSSIAGVRKTQVHGKWNGTGLGGQHSGAYQPL